MTPWAWRDLINYYCVFVVVLLAVSVNCGEESSGKLIIESAKRAMKASKLLGKKKHHLAAVRGDNTTEEVVGFDILLTSEQVKQRKMARRSRRHRSKRKAIRQRRYYWPGGVIPYSFSFSVDFVSHRARRIVRAAMDHWERHTCIRFQEYRRYKHGSDRLVVKRGEWCSSHLGRSGGDQYLYILPDCLTIGTIIHELGHTIGWIHEQARPDRDKYITVDWNRIPKTYHEQYQTEPPIFVNSYGVPYDYDSIMHYPDNDGELKTKDRSAQSRIGQRSRLSFYDKKLANEMYRCNAKCSKSIRCQEPGFVNHRCECVCPNYEQPCHLAGPTPRPIIYNRTEAEKDENEPFEEAGSDNCSWRYYRGRAANVISQKRLVTGSVDTCKLKCLEEKQFGCRSFHFSSTIGTCYLSKYWEKQRKFRHSGYIYFETPQCLANIDVCGWHKVPGSFVAMDDETSEITYDISVQVCKLLCLEERSFKCNAIMFRIFRPLGGTICVHTRAYRATHKTRIDARIDYYEVRRCNRVN